MRSYYSHLQATQTIGEEISIIQKPVFRSSAIFPVLHNDLYSSKILFLGYWLIKRNILELGLLYTLRNNIGEIISRKYLLVDAAKAYEIKLSEFSPLFKQNSFIGSLELEVFSIKDLVFPYPAFVLVYYNDNFSTAVHTAGRIYNDMEDLQSNEEYQVKESGFDIYPDKNISPFIAFTNGPIKNNNPKISYEIINCKGEKYKGEFNLDIIESFSTTFLEFKKHISLDELLLNKPGVIKVGHNFEGFFPRFVAGNFEQNRSSISITHTYYDSSEQIDDKSYWDRKDLSFNDSSVMIPIYAKDGFFTQLAIYPIFSPSDFILSFVFYDKHGNILGLLKDYLPIKSIENKYEVVDFGNLIFDNNFNLQNIVSANIICNWDNKNKIPTRVKFGLNVGVRDKEVGLPCNICFAPNLGNPNVLKKQGTFKWAPFINIGNSLTIITNSSPIKNYDKIAHLQLEFFRQKDNSTIKREFTLSANASLEISLDIDEELKLFFEDKAGWLTVTSSNPYINGWYFDFNKSGAVAGDHLF